MNSELLHEVDSRVRASMVLAGGIPSIPGGVNGANNAGAMLVMGGSADGVAWPPDSDTIFAVSS